MIIEYCHYCWKDTETLEIEGGDCKICGLSKPTPRSLIMSDDKKEWDETLEMLKGNDEIVVSDLSIGKYVTIKEELFHEIVEEVNKNRIENGDLAEGIDIIVLSEKESDEDIVVSDED